MAKLFKLDFTVEGLESKYFFTYNENNELMSLFVTSDLNSEEDDLIQKEKEKFPDFYEHRVTGEIFSVNAFNLNDAKKIALNNH